MSKKPLTENQRWILSYAVKSCFGKLSGGRYGWNTSQLRAMEKRGYVRCLKVNTWDSKWEVTEAGREALKEI